VDARRVLAFGPRTEEERNNKVFQGIQSSNLRKLRSGAVVAGASTDENMLKSVFVKKYKIPLDFDILSTHAPFYKFPIQEDIFEITLAPKEDVIVTDTTANMDYKLDNICLEYDTITNATIARELANHYNIGFSLYYDWIDYFKTTNIEANDTIINENINIPRI
jgi:hypothetical protein